MGVPVGIWIALLGYAIAWAGWRNMGVSYSAQSDGSIKASGQTYSLLDAFTCGKGTPAQGQPGSSTPAGVSATPTPSANPIPVPNLNPQGLPNPVPSYASVYTPAFAPAPAAVPVARPGILDALGAGGVTLVHDIGGLLGGLTGGHFSVPKLPPLQLPRIGGFNL